MKFFDGRKWPERRITFWMMIGSFLAMAITIVSTFYTVHVADSFNQKNFCFEKVESRLDKIGTLLHDLPRLVSGCGIEPATYCKDARATVERAKAISFEVSGLVTDKCLYHSRVETLLKKLEETQKVLDVTDESEGHSSQLVEIAGGINSLRDSFSNVKMSELDCHVL